MEDLLHRSLGEQVELRSMLAGGLWPAFTDANQLESALLNLAINARDAMPDGGRLTIETANAEIDEASTALHPEVEPGEYVVVSVSDTGIGMPPEVVAKAVDPFFTTKPVGEGTGLGLSMIYGFAKQSGGHLRISSEVGKARPSNSIFPGPCKMPSTSRPRDRHAAGPRRNDPGGGRRYDGPADHQRRAAKSWAMPCFWPRTPALRSPCCNPIGGSTL